MQNEPPKAHQDRSGPSSPGDRSTSRLDRTGRTAPAVVLLVAFEETGAAGLAARLAERLGDAATILTASGEDEALRHPRAAAADLVCVGPGLSGRRAAAFLTRVDARDEASSGRYVVLASDDETEPFQDLVDSDRLFYLCRKPPPPDEVAAVLESALGHDGRRRRLAGTDGADAPTATVAGAVSRVVDRIATEPDLERISGLLGSACAAFTDGDEGCFALYDAAQETLRHRHLDGAEATSHSAASGLVAFVARTARPLLLGRVGDDPRYDAEADNGGRSDRERFLAVPVLDPGSDDPRDVLAVAVATREATERPFGSAERDILTYLAARVAPTVRLRLLDARHEEALAAARGPRTADGEPLYRSEALQAYLDGPGGPGRVLELDHPGKGHRTFDREGGWLGRLRRFGERLRSRTRWRRVPYVQQTTKADCGAACLAMALRYHGKEVPLGAVRDALGVSRDGADARQILDGADWYGLRARAVKISEVEQLAALPPASILHWQFHHFVVFERMTDDGARVVDPAVGPRLVGRTELQTAFTGIAVVLEPAAAFEPEERRRGGAGRYFGQLLREWPNLVRVLGSSVALQALALALPLLTAVLVDRIVPQDDLGLLTLLAAGLAAVVVFQLAATLVRARLLLRLRVQLDSRMTLDFLDHLVDLPYTFFQQRSAGDLMARLNSNATVREILTSGAVSGALDGLLVSLYLIILLVVHPGLALLVLGLGALRVFLFLMLRRRHQELMSRALQTEAASRGYQVQMLAGIETLKSLGAERRAVEHWSNLFTDELNVALERGRLSAAFDAVLAALTVGSPFVILVYGAFEVIQGDLTLGSMLAVNALAAGFFAPLSTLVSTALQMQLLGSYFERIDDVLETEPEQKRGAALGSPELRGGIALEGVSFRYSPTGPLVVDDVSVEIAPGAFVALVGPSGAGKTTLAHLLAGLYRPTRGRILYDGVDLEELDLRAVRSQLGIVNQQPYIFGGSIAGNITLADPTLPRERMLEAARLAQIHDDVAAMPLGYETVLADAGVSLSGGQRQRLALARAVVHRPAILLLDEATSSLDTATERRIQEALAELRSTRIVIAHRLSTVRDADLILVMDGGRVIERGRHDELMDRGGTYGELVTVQMRA